MSRYAVKLIIVLLFSCSAYAAPSCTGAASLALGSGNSSGTLNTTGATLLVSGTSGLQVPTLIKDSQTNYWNYLSTWGSTSVSTTKSTIGWVNQSIVTSSSHTITNLPQTAVFQSAVFAFCTGTSAYSPIVNIGNTASSGGTTLTYPSFTANAGDLILLTASTNSVAWTVSTLPSCLGSSFTSLGAGGSPNFEGIALFWAVATNSGTCSASAIFSANTDWVGAVAVFVPSSPSAADLVSINGLTSTYGTTVQLAVGSQVASSGGYGESCSPANPLTGSILQDQGQIAFTPNGLMIWDDVNNNDVRAYNTNTFNVNAYGKTLNAGCTTLIAGQANAVSGGSYLSGPQPGTSATIAHPVGLSLDNNNNLYIADQQNNVVALLNYSTGILSVAVGSGPVTNGNCSNGSFGGDGGSPTSAKLNCPQGVTWVANNGNPYLIFGDSANHRVRAVNLSSTAQTIFNVVVQSGTINTIAGSGSQGCTTSGIATNAANTQIVSVAVNNGILYWADGGGSGCPYFMQVNSSGTLSVFAGTGSQAYLTTSSSAACSSFPFFQPFDIKFDNNNVAYLTDQQGATISMAKNGVCQFITGNPSFYGNRGGYGPVNGPARLTAMQGAYNTSVFGPIGATPDNRGFLWINDSGFNRILKMNVPCFGTCQQ